METSMIVMLLVIGAASFAKTASDSVDDDHALATGQERQETTGSGSKAGQSAAWGHKACHGKRWSCGWDGEPPDGAGRGELVGLDG